MTWFLKKNTSLKEWKKRIEITQQCVDSICQGSPETQNQSDTCGRKFILSFHLVMEAAKTCVCKLATQGSWWYGSVWVWRPENWVGAGGVGQRCKSWPESKGPKARATCLKVSQSKQSANLPFLGISVLIRPTMDWVMSTHIRESNIIYWVHQLKCKFIWKHLHRHTQK